ncbi:hypothetical protein M0802_013631 [Mischocyttarus mexicanus]|nr:hypothetical protein M0802_013636 [Mischocyttarus mexicanus]KAI4482520.1 hypothetical protein M0802_013631 [Mischocyttarus mexicanus]
MMIMTMIEINVSPSLPWVLDLPEYEKGYRGCREDVKEEAPAAAAKEEKDKEEEEKEEEEEEEEKDEDDFKCKRESSVFELLCWFSKVGSLSAWFACRMTIALVFTCQVT